MRVNVCYDCANLYFEGVKLHFLHHFDYWCAPYHAGSPEHQLQSIVLLAKAALELLCQLRVQPGIIVSNDWYTGLVPAYGRKSNTFGNFFQNTLFFHLIHNVEEGYEGKLYCHGDPSHIHQLPQYLIEDNSNEYTTCINASRCAVHSCSSWGTVSNSYLEDLLRVSPLANILAKFSSPVAHSNGIRVEQRIQEMQKAAPNRATAKKKLQEKYLSSYVDRNRIVFGFIGRICAQKGVHLILNAVEELIRRYSGRLQFIVGGPADMKDPYAKQCAWSIQVLRKKYPYNFYADPDSFFYDGALLNLGCDFGLVPSLFEPSGVVQQEFFSAGCPGKHSIPFCCECV